MGLALRSSCFSICHWSIKQDFELICAWFDSKLKIGHLDRSFCSQVHAHLYIIRFNTANILTICCDDHIWFFSYFLIIIDVCFMFNYLWFIFSLSNKHF